MSKSLLVNLSDLAMSYWRIVGDNWEEEVKVNGKRGRAINRNVGLAMSIASIIAMALVVCNHLPTPPKWYVIRWGVLWFFFASGFWFANSRKSLAENVSARVKSLLVPYYAWNVIWFPIIFVFNWVGWRYFGVNRVVDGSAESVVRCLGLSPFAWPALVPTWFLRALFVVVVIVGSLDNVLRRAAFGRNRLMGIDISRLVVCSLCCGVYWAWHILESKERLLQLLFVFGIPLSGCAWFAVGMVIEGIVHSASVASRCDLARCERSRRLSECIRRHIIPVYLIHVPVILFVEWGFRAFHCYNVLETNMGNAVMWGVGVIGAISVGELMRRKTPCVAEFLFGGR